jgi:hypothetical protein
VVIAFAAIDQVVSTKPEYSFASGRSEQIIVVICANDIFAGCTRAVFVVML